MHIRLILLVSVTCFIVSTFAAATPGVTSAATSATAKPKAFEARSIEANEGEDDDDEVETQAQTHLAYRNQQQQRPLYDYSQSEEEQEQEPPRQVYQSRQLNNRPQQQTYYKQQQQQPKKQSSEEESVEEEEEPDRLSTLLAKSTFSCNSKNSGYYADESFNCEIFHYCQENQRHSWICPEGFTFHQIHLICMPPSNENICQQSSKYQFVNDYLYKPINLQEHQSKPNVTLRYSDRYYPESYYDNDRYSDEQEEAPRQRIQHSRQPLQVGFQQQLQQQTSQHQQVQPQVLTSPQPQPQPQYQRPVLQQVRHQPTPTTVVFRRPVTTTTIQPQVSTISHQLQQSQYHQQQQQQHQQQQQQQHQQQQQQAQRLHTAAPIAATPTPYRFFTATPQLQHIQQQQQQVYRSPEEINISLQQRRPQVFVATTPRYYEDEYLYERRK